MYFLKENVHAIWTSNSMGESGEVFLLGRDGLNNDAVHFSKHFNPNYVIKMSQMKRVMTSRVK